MSTLTIGGYLSASGTYTLNAGSLSVGTAYVGIDGAASFVQNGGSAATSTTLYVAYDAGSSAYTLNGGTLTTATTQVSDGGTATFTQTGGTHTTGTLRLTGYLTGSVGTYNLLGGLLTTGQILNRDVYGSQTGRSTFLFSGGTLQASASSTAFMQGLTAANVGTGGARIDTQGFNDTIAQNLAHDPAAGAPATDGGLLKLGTGTLTLTGTNTFTGPVTLNAGTLAVTSEANLGSGPTVTVNGSARLTFAGSATLTREYDLGTSTLTAASGSTLTFGNHALVNGGYLAGPGTDALGNGSTVNAAVAQIGSTLVQNDGGAAMLNNVTVRGTLNQTSGTLAVNNVTATTSSQIVVGGTVNAAGTELDGTTTINNGGVINAAGTSLYLGAGSRTTINAGGTLAAGGTSIELNGALLVNNAGGTQSGVLNVNYGSTAKGTGTFGTVNVTDGGRFGTNATAGGVVVNGLSVFRLTGASGLAGTAFVGPQLLATPGTVNIASLALGSGSIFAFSVQDAQGAAGSGYDLAHASGTLTLAAGTTAGNLITISLASLGSSGTAGQAANFDPSRNYTFVLVQADSGISGYNPAEFVVDASAFQNATNGGSFSVVQQGNNLDLVFNAVPEPSTWALFGAGAVGMGCVALRRRRVTGAEPAATSNAAAR